MTIKKALIPAAGFGTRMLPAAKAVPKELLPILDRPTIQYVVDEAAAGGIDDVLLVTSREKGAIEDHFKPNARLRQRLEAGGKDALLASVDRLVASVKIHSVDQPEQRGLGDAVFQGRNNLKSEPFLCLLGDTIFSGNVLPAQQLIQAHKELGTAIIGLEEIPAERVDRYGIVGGTLISPSVMKIDRLVEKPKRDEAPSRFAIAARYILTPAIFECLEQTTPGKGGEFQLTDALQVLLAREPIHGIVLSARRHDIGNPIDWLKTNLIFARRDEKMWKEISTLLNSLVES